MLVCFVWRRRWLAGDGWLLVPGLYILCRLEAVCCVSALGRGVQPGCAVLSRGWGCRLLDVAWLVHNFKSVGFAPFFDVGVVVCLGCGLPGVGCGLPCVLDVVYHGCGLPWLWPALVVVCLGCCCLPWMWSALDVVCLGCYPYGGECGFAEVCQAGLPLWLRCRSAAS